ncbi:MAG TPA: glycosyltransferase [Bacteroidia bacterium]
MPEQKNILVLYTELAYYTVSCFSMLAKKYDVNIHILRMPVNKSAPFQFNNLDARLHIYNAHEFDSNKLHNLCDKIKPSLIYCAGWTNKTYLDFCKIEHKKCNTLLGFDTQWNGSIKQILGAFYSRFAIKPHFNYVFVPGKSQAQLAEKMGFKNEQIIKGAYSADVDLFKAAYDKNKPHRKVIIFVGRYSPEKGIADLCETFIDLSEKNEINGWQLWCVGKGDYKIPHHPALADKGFMQPKELSDLMKEINIFVLPSTYEPWGVVVHEFAAAGVPLLCSNKVGATEVFLKNGENGFIFNAGDKNDLRNKIKTMCNLSIAELQHMEKISYALGQTITPETWADSLYKTII